MEHPLYSHCLYCVWNVKGKDADCFAGYIILTVLTVKFYVDAKSPLCPPSALQQGIFVEKLPDREPRFPPKLATVASGIQLPR